MWSLEDSLGPLGHLLECRPPPLKTHWLASEYRDCGFCRPSAGTTSICHHVQLFLWVLEVILWSLGWRHGSQEAPAGLSNSPRL